MIYFFCKKKSAAGPMRAGNEYVKEMDLKI